MQNIFLIVFLIFLTSLHAQQIKNYETEHELEELIIQIEKIDSKWYKPFKKAKQKEWTESPIILTDGFQIISQYTLEKDIKFNGTSFLVIAPKPEDDLIKRKFKPILFKVNQQGDTISLIEEEYLEKNNIKNTVKSFEFKIGSRLEFEFPYLIKANKNEVLYIGFEMIRDKSTPMNYHDIVWIGPCRKINHPNLKTTIIKGSSHNSTESLLYFDRKKIPQDIYFELKKVK